MSLDVRREILSRPGLMFLPRTFDLLVNFMPTFFSFLFFFSFFSTTKEETGIGVPKRYDSLFEQVYLIERFRTYGTGELMKLGIRFV